MKSKAVLFVIFLGGCVTTPVVVEKPKVVEVPVSVPCIKEPVEKPEFAGLSFRGGSVYDKGVAVLTELEQRKAYESKLEAVMLKCLETKVP